ncbi:OmpA family protein [Roseovarius sp. EGI FJ00037]|uniref:OmpA family protein n=1 Tax=Roseovarius salincola TaxID=2978479 RepID=UPI0022A82BF4|nr:OmpA family protein [Roseovarius sp. EGI FJ00037]MCZ0811848.1 OmpA family protein [Roseovarius sp. EGI FJ00037]
MRPPLNAKRLAPLAFVVALLAAPSALAEMRIFAKDDGTIQFVDLGESAALEEHANSASAGSEAVSALPSVSVVAEENATGSTVMLIVTGSSAAASPSTSASAAAEPGESGSASAEPGEAEAADREMSDDAFAEAPPPPDNVFQEKAAAPITAQFTACETISLGDTVLFDTAAHVLKPHAGPALDAVANVLLAQPSIQVRIEGHTDSRGGLQYNEALSERRAKAVYQALLQREVPPGRLEVVGYGLTQPTDTNNTAAGRANNRRVDLVPFNC